MPFKSSTIKDVTAFLKTARDRFAAARSGDEIDRKEAEDCVKFAAGGDGQWDTESLELRRPPNKERPARPVVTWNVLRDPINHICNNGRQMKPSIKTSPMDGGNKETSEYLQSRIRHFEYESDADIAYDTARYQQVISGRGWYRIRTDYKSYRSNEQTIIIDEIENQFSVMPDISAKRYDKSDADWYFIGSRVSKEWFESEYGKPALEHYTNFGNDDSVFLRDWRSTDDMIPHYEYWVRTYTKENLYTLTTGTTLLESELADYGLELRDKKIYQLQGGMEVPIKTQRRTKVPTVTQYIIDGSAILDEHEWLGTIIPFLPQFGEKIVVDGRRRNKGIVHDARDPQRIVNLTVSNIAELTSQINKTKATVAEGQLAGHEDEWMPNNDYLYRQYKRWDENGRDLGQPIYERDEPPIQALSMQLNQAIDGVKKATAIFSASQGDRSNETSGKAIDARKVESDIANFHFLDNEGRTRKLAGRIILELIAKLDGKEPKQVPIRGVDGKASLVWINKEHINDKGEKVTIKPSEGEYDVEVSTGPSYTSQRQEAADTFSKIAENDKNFMPLAGDLFFRALDAPGADIIADRYEQAVIPQQFRKAKDGQERLPPKAQAALAQAQQHLQAIDAYAKSLEQKLAQMQATIDAKKVENDVKLQIEAMKEQSALTIKAMELQHNEGLALMKAEMESIKHSLELAQSDKQMAMQALPKDEAAAQGQGQPQPEQQGAQ